MSAALFFSAPLHGQFYYSDAPRHALNGIFLHDLLVAMPITHLKQWAIDYYLQYPALTIMFYPPGLATAEMVGYFLFGESHATAVAVVCAFDAALIVGAFKLASRWLPFWQAWAVGAIVAGLPEVALWARQPMTDVPAFAFLMWSAVLLLRYIETKRPLHLYLAAVLFLLGLYTKQSIVFLLPVYLALLWTSEGSAVLRNRHVWIVSVLFGVLLVPLIVMTVEFGQGNVQSVVSVADSQASRSSLAAWIYYSRLLPQQAGWLVLVLAGIAAVGALLVRRWRLPKLAAVLFYGWIVAGYIFFSAIDLKAQRLDLFILLPFAFFAALGINRMLPPRWATAGAIAVALATFGYTLVYAPVPLVTGYQQAAEWIAKNTPGDSIVAFSGQRDGAFIYDLRLLDRGRQRRVVRVDKLLLSISIRRELGVVEKESDPAAIAKMFNDYGISYIVAERDFFTDLKPMAAFQKVMETPGFVEVARLKVDATFPHTDKELRIYRNASPLP